MLKKTILVSSLLATFVLTNNVNPAQALELDEDTRTVMLDTKGNNCRFRTTAASGTRGDEAT